MRVKENIALEFDEFSKNYTQDMIACVPHYLALNQSFIKGLPKDFTPHHILDLGCGNGNVTALLLQYFPKAQYTLLDASPQMIELCQKQFKDYNIQYVTSYFKDFSFEEEAYDFVVAGFSIHHCESAEKQELFPKVYKALQKGGILSITDLMINKKHEDHPLLLKEWGTQVNHHFPDGEKWKWIM